MKKFLAAAALVLFAAASPVLAGIGGPDGYMLFSGHNDPKFLADTSVFNATYQGTIQGQGEDSNLAGIMLFGTGATSEANAGTTLSLNSVNNNQSLRASEILASGLGTSQSEGRCLVFVKGQSIYGQMSTVVDTQNGDLAGIIAGSVERGRDLFQLSMITGSNYSYNYNRVITTDTNGRVTDTTNITISDTITLQIPRFVFLDVITMNGYFNAKFSKFRQSFNGEGRVAIIVSQPIVFRSNEGGLVDTVQASVRPVTKEDHEKAKEDIGQAKEDLATAQANLAKAQADYNQAQRDYNQAQREYNQAEREGDMAKMAIALEKMNAAETEMSIAQNNIAIAQDEMYTARRLVEAVEGLLARGYSEEFEVRVSGVKTAGLAPVFNTVVTLQQPVIITQ